ncbi:MAG TPA: DUF3500 domain-containing protein [Pyrinomonadaceae bacterium]|jgi:hypothetical protein
MKKILILSGAIIVALIGGFILYSKFFSGSSFSSVNIQLGAVDEKAVAGLCRDKSGHVRLVCLADELKKTVSGDLLANLQRDYSVSDAQKWSNFPPVGYRNRIGPTLDKFNPAQLAIIKAILKEAAGTAANEGYDEIDQLLNADDYLSGIDKGAGFGSGSFHLAFLGTPANSGMWQFYFGGHHLAVSLTYKDGKIIGATPSFRGVEPFGTFTQNGRENQPLNQERDAFAAMLNALDENEKNKAKLSQTFTDIIVGPRKDNNFPASPNGIRVGDLSREKQELIIKGIEKYVIDTPDADSKVLMEKYQSELADTYIAYSGTTDMNTANDYVRIDGPSVWIEFSMQPSPTLKDGSVHPHSVWRDKKTDYGGNSSK